MAKARITNKGNVQVVMSPEQWQIVNELFQHVRLGNRNAQTRLFSNLVIDLDDFNYDNGFSDDYNLTDSDVSVSITLENSRGMTRNIVEDFTIELDSRDENTEDWD
jgi:hypothetical protein